MDAYKFPHEVEAEAKEEIEVEIVDDVPEGDRNREALPQEIVDELEKDDLTEYSDKVKKRLGQMKKVWHDERRAKETSTREKDEAIRVAQSYFDENKQLKQRLGAGEKLFVDGLTKEANAELASAKESLKNAYDAGDGSLIADAQEALTEAKLKIRDFEFQARSLQNEENRVNTPEQAQIPDQKAETWRQSNAWFGVDEEMTALALGLHEKLVRSGVDPRSDDYYRKVDETMRKRFAENFEPQRKAANIVAPATRSTAPNKVRLTQTQMGLAKRFGLTPEAYAKEVIKLENTNG